MCLDDLKALFHEQGVWTKDDEARKEELDRKIKIGQKQVAESEFQTAKLKVLKKQVKALEEELKQLSADELNLFSCSAESRAEEFKRRHMVRMFTENIDEEPYWQDERTFLDSTDQTLIFNLIIAYFKTNFLSEKRQRQIVRSGEWRYRWEAAKHGEALFGKPIADWSEMQNMIVYWSEYYDGIYQSFDRPGDHIINDDDACDAWVREQNKKMAQENDHNKSQKSGKRASRKMDHAEKFVMVQRGDQEAIEKVQDMNTEQTRERIQREWEQQKKAGGRIKEWDLGNRKHNTPVVRTRKGR